MSVIQPAAPLAVIVDRIKWHANSANALGLLHGMKWKDVPHIGIQGKEDLPSLQFIEYTDSEDVFAGGKTGGDANVNTHVQPSATVTLMLSNRRDAQLFSLEGSSKRGLINWVALLRDALELKQVGAGLILDTSLNETCGRPFFTKVRDNVVLDISWSVAIEITIFPLATVRGTRRDLQEI